ncbi:MAG TPA: polysaccharide deacetylase family protein [Pseudonocardia sp.]|jgi:peptidoglycan/xylan/chitin deacetylase (PgdA/CDA1 family)|nr:polysaccharide deacetylase family protein [Pseudonocardia sp.]
MSTSTDTPFAADESRWPAQAVAAVSITMDNMGEAFELEAGIWPSDEPVGRHFSVHRSLPRMLDILASHSVRATYFVEAWNTDVYPEQILEVAARGHEVALHGFRHEPWSGLDPEREEALINSSARRFQQLGISLKGFRPPGGGLNPDTQRFLAEHGIYYSSPAAEHATALENHVIVPFRWEWIDAFCYFEPLEEMRRKQGHPPGLIEPREFESLIARCIDEIVDSGGFAALLFHPFLHDDEDRLAVMDRLVERVSSDPRLWCAPCDEIATWVRERPSLFDKDPGLVDQSWLK